MSWFGPPWPSAERRAEVCKFDEDSIPVPVTSYCIGCGNRFTPTDRGVRVSAFGSPTGVSYHDYHLKCFLAETLGERLAQEAIAEMEKQ